MTFSSRLIMCELLIPDICLHSDVMSTLCTVKCSTLPHYLHFKQRQQQKWEREGKSPGVSALVKHKTVFSIWSEGSRIASDKVLVLFYCKSQGCALRFHTGAHVCKIFSTAWSNSPLRVRIIIVRYRPINSRFPNLNHDIIAYKSKKSGFNEM